MCSLRYDNLYDGLEVLVKRQSCLGNQEALPNSMNISSSKENGGADGGIVKAKLTLSVCRDDGSGISSIRGAGSGGVG